MAKGVANGGGGGDVQELGGLFANNGAYKSQGSLLTEAEKKFWLSLIQVLPRTVVACPKVRFMDVVTERDPNDKSSHGRIAQKHLDFVLMHVTSTRILAAIELDDWHHRKAHVKANDNLKTEILNDVGIPLLRVPVTTAYSLDLLQRQVSELLGAASKAAA